MSSGEAVRRVVRVGATATEPWRPPAWNVKVAAGAGGQAADATEEKVTATGVLDTNDETGEFWAIVAVTGIVDEVDDVIEVGAFEETLAKRTPKGVWGHDWTVWVARSEEVAELAPGDKRLPEKLRDGRPWPVEAGAAWVHGRCNLETQAGREAFSNIKFFGGDFEWSIGYHVPAGRARRSAKGIRHIRMLEWFEYSGVLFGAMSHTRTLAYKAASPTAEASGMGDTDLVTDDNLGDLFGALGDGLDWDDIEALGGAVDETGADLDDETPVDETVHALGEAWTASGLKSIADRLEAAGAVDLGYFEAKAEGGVDKNRGGAERLRRYWTRGAGAAKIAWGTPGDFKRCVTLVSEHMDPKRAKGYCALRHKEATGEWAGPNAHGGVRKPAKKETDAVTETKSMYVPDLAGSLEQRTKAVADAVRGKYASDDTTYRYASVVNTFSDHVLVRVTETPRGSSVYGSDGQTAERYDKVPYAIADDGAVTLGEATEVTVELQVEAKSLVGSRVEIDADGSVRILPAPAEPPADGEAKSFPYLSGSFEERQAAIREAVREALRGEEQEDGGWEFWVYLHSTFADHVIATRSGRGNPDETYWRLSYGIGEDGAVTVGEPQQVELEVTVGEVVDGDAGGTSSVSAAPEVLSKALGALAEAKAGRVLSAANEGLLVGAVRHIVEVLRKAGIEVVIEEAAIEKPSSTAGGDAPTRQPAKPDTTSPGAGETKDAPRVSDEPWGSFDPADYDEKQWHRACLVHGHESGAPEAKDACRLPVREPDGTLNRGAVHAAAEALADGGAVPEEGREAAAKALLSLYRRIGDDAPETLREAAGAGQDPPEGEAKAAPDSMVEIPEHDILDALAAVTA